MSGPGETFVITVLMDGVAQTEAGAAKVTASVREMGVASKEAGAQGASSLGNYSAATRRAEASSVSLSQRLTSTGKTAEATGKKLTHGLTLPLLGVGAVAAKMSLDFNRSMLLVSTQAGATHKEVERMSSAILKLSASGRFAQGPKELSEALFDIESVGFRGAKALDTLKASSDLATVGGAELEATTSALVGTLKTGIKGAGNMKDAIGTLNATIGAGKMHMDDLNGAIGTGFLGPAARFGVSLHSVGAALAELTAQSTPANSAATRLRMTMSLLESPTTKAKEVLKEIGIGSKDLARELEGPKGILGALELLQDHMHGLSRIEQNQLLSSAFGGAKSGGTILQLIGNLDDLAKKQQEIVKNSGDIGQALKETNADPAVQFEKDWSALQAVLIELGNVVIPAITPVIHEITKDIGHVAKAFEGLSPSTQSWIIKIGLAAAALGPLLSIGGKLLKVFGAVAKATEGIGAAAATSSAVPAAEGLGAGGMAAGGEGAAATAAAVSVPELLAGAAAIAAVTAALILLYKHSATFRKEVGQLGDAASHAFGEISDQVEPLVHSFSHLGNAFNHLHGPIGTIAKLFKGEFITAVHAAFNGAANVIKGFGKMFAGEVQVIRGVVELISDLLEGKFGKAWGAVKTIFSGGVKATLGILEAITGPMRGAASAIGGALSKTFSGAWGTIKGVFQDGINAVIGLLNDMIELVDELPFVHIGTIGKVGGGSHGRSMAHARQDSSRAAAEARQHRFSGGAITKPTAIVGEEAPQHPEMVIASNPAYRQKNIGHWVEAGRWLGVPGFAFGGPIGEAAGAVGGAVGGAAREVAGLGVGAVLDALPSPADVLPKWLVGFGDYLEKELEDWVRGKAPKKAPGGVVGPKGVGSYEGVAMANWVIESLQYAASKGVKPHPTSGYRPASQVISGPVVAPQGHSEHQGTQYPHGAVDFGGPYDPAAKRAKMEVVHATSGFKYPLLAPIGFRDDGHASGTGHRRGGLLSGPGDPIQFYRTGGPKRMIVKGKVSWFTGGATAGGKTASSDAGLALNLHPGSEGGWDNATTRGWMAKSKAGHPVLGDTTIAGHHAVLPIIDLGPAGFTGRAIDVTAPGVAKLGLSTASFPTDSIGTVMIGSGGSGASGAAPKVPAHAGFKVTGGRTSIGGGTFAPGAGQVSTAKLSFGSLPNDLHGVRKELRERRAELQQYQIAYRQSKRQDEKAALMVNIKLLQNRISALLKQQAKLAEARRRKRVASAIEKRGSFPDLAARIAGDETAYNRATEFSQQVVALEPESFTAAYEQQESGAFLGELGAELKWRNDLISSGEYAGSMIAKWESDIRNIERLKAKHPDEYNRRKFRIPALRKAIANAQSTRGDWASTLTDVQGIGGPAGVLTELPTEPKAGSFGGDIFQTQMEIRDLGLHAQQSATEALSGLNELLKQENAKLRNEVNLHNAQAPILAEYTKANQPPYLGAYKEGGILPADGYYYGHKDETIIPAESGPLSETHVHLHGKEGVLEKIIETEVEHRLTAAGRRVGLAQATPSAPGRRAVMSHGRRRRGR